MKNALIPGTTTAEAEVLAATAAALAAGNDPFGDNDDDDGATIALPGADDDADDPQAAAGGDAADGDTGDAGDNTGDDATLTPEQLAALAADDATADPAPVADRFKAADPAEMATQRKELTAQKAKALKDLMDGVIEPEEYSRIESEVSDKLDALTVQRTLHEANTQRDASTWDNALEAVMVAAKEAGTIDYTTDAAAAKQFDMATSMLKVDGKQRTPAQLATEAHKAVLAMRGIAATAPTPKTEPAQPRANGKPPLTLRNVPAAAMPNAGGNWQDALSKLSGQEYETAYAKLTQAQRDTLLND